VAWYRQQVGGADPRALMLADIARYAALGKAYP
jgi:hypothetical protein